MSGRRSRSRIRAASSFLGWYLVNFLQANYTVTKEIVTRTDGLAPTFVEIPLRVRTRFEIASFVSLITLSPGTLVIALSPDRTRLLAHSMHAGDPASFEAELLELERRMLAAWRPAGAEDPASGSERTREG